MLPRTRHHSANARLTLLLCLLPNLEMLYLEDGFWGSTFLEALHYIVHKPANSISPFDEPLQDLFDINKGPQPYCSVTSWDELSQDLASNLDKAFQKLQSIRIASVDDYAGHNSDGSLRPMLALPSLRSLEISRLNAYWSDHEWPVAERAKRWPDDAGWSSIERMSFIYSTGSKTFINAWLKAPRALKHFYYSYGEIETDSAQFTPRDLAASLQCQQATLELLDVDFDDDYQKKSWKNIHNSELFFGAALRDFYKLNVLRSSQQVLLGLLHVDYQKMLIGGQDGELFSTPYRIPRLDSMLPEGLEELTIKCCDLRVMSALEHLSRAIRKGYFPNLRKVSIEFAEETTKKEDVVLSAWDVKNLPLELLFRSEQYRKDLVQALSENKISPLFGDSLTIREEL